MGRLDLLPVYVDGHRVLAKGPAARDVHDVHGVLGGRVGRGGGELRLFPSPGTVRLDLTRLKINGTLTWYLSIMEQTVFPNEEQNCSFTDKQTTGLERRELGVVYILNLIF